MVQLAMSFPINHEYKFETLKADLINLEKKTLKSCFFSEKGKASTRQKLVTVIFAFFSANVCRFPILEHWFLAGKFGARFSEMYIRPIFSTAISKKGRADGPTVAEAKGGIQVESHNDLIVGIFGGFFGM